MSRIGILNNSCILEYVCKFVDLKQEIYLNWYKLTSCIHCCQVPVYFKEIKMGVLRFIDARLKIKYTPACVNVLIDYA